MLDLQQPALHIFELILNRPEKHNAFNAELIDALRLQLKSLANNPDCHVLILRANGKSFCSGADLEWMKSMLNYSLEENIQDAEQLAFLLHELNTFPAPTIAVVQGSAFGGGVGLVACCDIAFAANNATFCFSEVKLGLTPSTIAPYILAAMGEKLTRRYFLSAELFDAETAVRTNLINEVVTSDKLYERALQMAITLSQHGNQALRACKTLIQTIKQLPENEIATTTANHIALQRVSDEAQQRLGAFLCSKKS